MKIIKLQSITLLNFQGVKNANYHFGTNTWVCGDNGTGKTTIMDAFMWCMFGKNSKGKTDKDFDIKTLDADGNVIWRQPHEVSISILVDDVPTTFRRCFCEKWVKQRGSIEEEFKGHETEYYVNDVPKSMRDYKAKVADIIEEDVFRMITDPAHFLSLKKDVQRSFLIDMYGNISDENIAKSNESFAELLSKLVGKDLEEYREQLKKQLSMLKQEIDVIPVQIEERQRSIAEMGEEDYAHIECSISDLKNKQDELSMQINDIEAVANAAQKKQNEYNANLLDINKKRLAREAEIKNEHLVTYYNDKAKVDELMQIIKDCNNLVQIAEASVKMIDADIASYKKQINDVNEEIARVRSTKFKLKREDVQCPTCGHLFSAEEQRKIFDDLMENFNINKANKLKELEDRLIFINNTIAELEKQKNDTNAKIIKDRTKAARSTSELKNYSDLPSSAPDVSAKIAHDEIVISLMEQEKYIKNKMSFCKNLSADTSNLQGMRNAIQEQIDALNKKLLGRDIIKRDNERIDELMSRMRKLSQDISAIEQDLQTIYEFKKAKVLAIEDNINSHFENVKFKMFKMQINGGETEDCEALVGGVPYSRSLNSASKINAGLDIINALSKHYNISAPVFIDNAESSNHYIDGISQRIYLKVTNDGEIIIIL